MMFERAEGGCRDLHSAGAPVVRRPDRKHHGPARRVESVAGDGHKERYDSVGGGRITESVNRRKDLRAGDEAASIEATGRKKPRDSCR